LVLLQEWLWSIRGTILICQNRISRRKTLLNDTFSATNPTLSRQRPDSLLRADLLATNCLSFDTSSVGLMDEV